MNPIESIKKYVRAVNYLTVTQIYLQSNILLSKKLTPDDIKPKLFGHWGTCPGINFVYGNLQYLVKKHELSAIFVLGPGHGFPALQANLFIEETLQKYYPKAKISENGMEYLSKYFSWPYGFSSHSNPEAPGLILEGGELGYSLSTAYGAVLDNPDLLAVCMIGDGEAETGALSASWHINKLMDPVNNGAVLPILHVNGYKISGPTVFGRMSDEELINLFKGYGYEPFIVEGSDDKVYGEMFGVLEKCYQKIRQIQLDARQNNNASPRLSSKRPRPSVSGPIFPMIILKTPKGWTTIKEFRGQKIEGTILAHQVVMPNVKGDEEELRALEEWLKSYKFNELYDKKSGFVKEIIDLLPNSKLRIGDNPHMFGRMYKKLNLPKSQTLEKKVHKRGELSSNSMRMAGEYLKYVFMLNKTNKNFRLFSPDETYSNRLDEIFKESSRAFVWPIYKDDKDISRDGRVMEMLSEHNMHGLAQGYVLTGRHTIFTTYEAFAQIFSSMSHMYQKFLKHVRKTPWREDIASLNYLLTSTVWRQEHNGYSHQNPSFISGMLEKHNDFVKVYFPADDNSMLAVMEEALSSINQINTIIAGKTPEPRYLTLKEAKEQLKNGISTWKFASDENPQIVVTGIGDYVTKEALAAIETVKNDFPDVRIRFVNLIKLSAVHENEETAQIPNAEKHFTHNTPVIVNFHGYPEVMKSVLFKVKNPERFLVHGYREWGGTTTPFDMQVRNKTDRFNLAIEILETLVNTGVLEKEKAERFIVGYKERLKIHHDYIVKYGKDMDEIANWEWSGNLPRAEIKEKEKVDVLKSAKTIAFIGLSDKKERHSFQVAKYFQDKGFRIIPINPNIKEVLGEKSYQSLNSIPKEYTIDIVDIFRKSSEVMKHLKEVMDRGDIHTVWLAEGISNHEIEDFAQDYGLNMVTNFCIVEAYKKMRV